MTHPIGFQPRPVPALALPPALPPEALLRILVEEALSPCDADTDGVSLLEADPAGGGERFRSPALAGALAAFAGAAYALMRRPS